METQGEEPHFVRGDDAALASPEWWLAANIRAIRAVRKLNQTELAARMRGTGFPTWTGQAVGQIERGARSVKVDELIGLAWVLGVSPNELLIPYRRRASAVTIGEHAALGAEQYADWLEGRPIEEER